jgi:two-component system sensor histidine kinase/response regulator
MQDVGTKPREVLIVDDEVTLRLLVGRHVTKMGHRVQEAHNGRQALEMLHAHDFDLVLLDVVMPELNGFAVLEEIRRDERLRQVAVVMVTAVDDLQSVVRCIEMGADDYLIKPFNPTLLRARVRACLEKKQLWDELREKYRQLRELEALRDSLTHMVVHDLRQPLQALLGGLEMVPILGELNPDQQEFIQLAADGGRTLLGMVNDLLDISKMESGTLQLELARVRPENVIEEAVRQVHQLVKEKSLALVTECEPGVPEVAADSEKLRRTLVNLLGNAIKFTPVEGEIAVTARHDADHGGVLFAVRDSGEGIPEEAFGRIFEKFGQVETRKEGRKMSTGLGLTFCKMAVEAHGGRIWVESRLGHGSSFYFTIPPVSAAQPNPA